MSMYEGVRLISDKLTVVFDIGSAYTKYGFTGESVPRGIIRTEVRCSETTAIRKVFLYEDADDLYQLLVEFIHLLFFRHVAVSPKDIKVIVVESILTPTDFRNTLAKVLFRHFEIGSLMLVPSHLVAVSTLGISTALVLDVGYKEATLIPVYEGVPVLKAWQALPLAAQAIHGSIKEELQDVLVDGDVDEKILEDIKVRTCFVTTLERSAKLGTVEAPVAPPSVRYPGVKTVTIPGTVREKAFELLWQRDNDNLSIPTMILDAIVKCPVDMRRPLAENILLIGGTTMSKGFLPRLKSELIALLKSNLYCDKLKLKTFKFHTAPCQPNYTAWLGGAIFGITDLPLRCLTKENYLKLNRVPDWASLIDNQKPDTIRNIV